MKKLLLFIGSASCLLLLWVIFLQDQAGNVGLTPKQLAKQEFDSKKIKREAGFHKSDNPDEYAKWHHAIRTREGAAFPDYKFNYKLVELGKARQELAKIRSKNGRTQNLDWIERGPANVPGRARGIIVFPNVSNLSTWLVGSVGGGIWKTTNAGESWVNKTPDFPNLGTTSLAMSESNTSTVYAGTGEQYAGYIAVNGDGIFKSLDAGETWTQLSSTAGNNNFRNINRIIVSPSTPDILLAATSNHWWDGSSPQSKIMRSTDGGQTWAKVYENDNDIDHIVYAPSDFNIQYASINSGGIIKSTDGGLTWTLKSDGLSTLGRMEIAVANNDPNRVYVSAEGSASSESSDLFVSFDGGDTWALSVAENNGSNPDFLGGQGFYDNTIAVHPYNDDVVYTGGVNIFKFTITGVPTESDLKILGAEEDGTDDFMEFVEFTDADYKNGSVYIFTSEGEDITADEFVSVEIRFGPGKQQKAHRFTVPAGSTSGVPVSGYSYQDYVDVPFEVWDITNNKQLMVSFRDQQRDGTFNLNPDGSDEDWIDSREYLFISSIEYDESTPDPTIGQDGGRTHKQMYFFWPYLSEDATWDPENMPDSKLVVKYGVGLEVTRFYNVVADAYDEFSGPNQFSQTDPSNITGPHPDHHGLQLIKVDENSGTFRIINTSDGGVYYSNTSENPGQADGTWNFAGFGMNTTQFYGIDKKPGFNEYIGGTQDNGTWKSPGGTDPNDQTNYERQLPGDGFEVAWNYRNTELILGSIYYNDIRRSTNGGISWSQINDPNFTDNTASTAPFITKLANVKFDPDIVYTVGQSGVWKSNDFGSSWKLTPMTDEGWGLSRWIDIDISLANSKVVWAGERMSTSGGLFVSEDGGSTFSKTNNYEREMGVITGMASDPYDENTFYALFSFSGSPKILKTIDLGQSWTDISGFGIDGTTSSNGFPDVAVYCMLVRPDNPDILWVGTEIGLFESTDAGLTWHLADNGLPAVSIWDMKVVDDQIVLGTHGRGIWTTTIPELDDNQNYVTNSSYLGQQQMNVEVSVKRSYDKMELFSDGIKVDEALNVSAGVLEFTIPKTTNGPSELYVVAYDNNVTYTSPISLSTEVNFAPTLTAILAENQNELIFDIDINENYSSIECYINGELVSTTANPSIGNLQIPVSGLNEGETYEGYVIGYLNGEGYQTDVQSIQVISGLFGSTEVSGLKLYPNPTKSFLNVSVSNIDLNQSFRLEIYSLNGVRVDCYDYQLIDDSSLRLDLNELDQGMYFIKIEQNQMSIQGRLQVVK